MSTMSSFTNKKSPRTRDFLFVRHVGTKFELMTTWQHVSGSGSEVVSLRRDLGRLQLRKENARDHGGRRARDVLLRESQV